MAIPVLLGFAAKAAIGVGVTSGVLGAKKINNSKERIKNYKFAYESEKEKVEKIEKNTAKEIEELGKTKLKVWNSFERFVLAFEKIKNKPEFIRYEDKEYKINVLEIEEIKGISIKATQILGSAALAGGAGAAIGMATSSVVATFGVASTGATISGLYGVAATNATLAWLGGGSLAVGGGGMAAGSLLLGTIVAAPAAVVGGLFLNSKGNASKENANKIRTEVREIVSKFKDARAHLNGLSDLSKKMNKELHKLYEKYEEEVSLLEYLVRLNNDYNKFGIEEKTLLDNNIKIVSILKNITDIELVKNSTKDELGDLNIEELDEVLRMSEEQREILSNNKIY